MKKMLCLIIFVQACVYKPVVDTAGRSGTFDKSKIELKYTGLSSTTASAVISLLSLTFLNLRPIIWFKSLALGFFLKSSTIPLTI